MATSSTVELSLQGAALRGDLVVPTGASGIVLFAHGSGSSRLSPRNRRVAAGLHDARLATLLLDLLTEQEESFDNRTRELRLDIGLLGDQIDCGGRLVGDRCAYCRDVGRCILARVPELPQRSWLAGRPDASAPSCRAEVDPISPEISCRRYAHQRCSSSAVQIRTCCA